MDNSAANLFGISNNLDRNTIHISLKIYGIGAMVKSCLWAQAPFSQGSPKLKASTTKIPPFGGVFVLVIFYTDIVEFLASFELGIGHYTPKSYIAVADSS